MTPQINPTNRWWNGPSSLISTLLGTPKDAQTNRRNQGRMKMQFQATVSGPMGSIPVSGVDIHHHGLGVVSNTAVAVGSVVFVHVSVKRVGLMGFAHVRHCTQRGGKFFMGLEFQSEPMREELGSWQFQRIPASSIV